MRILPVIGFEGYYDVSDTGRIFSCERVIEKTDKRGWKLLFPYKRSEKKQRTNNRGYKIVDLSKKGKSKTFLVHRLVALAFIPNPLNLSQVNHKDCNKHNNNDWNLEWMTNIENKIHGYKNNRFDSFKGENSWFAKLTEKDVLEIRKKYDPIKENQNDLAKEYDVTQSSISNIIRGKCWKHI